MRNIALAAGLMCLAGCLPFDEKRVIVVDGEGTATAAPDQFTVRARIATPGADRKSALTRLSAQLAEINEKMPGLEGLSAISVNTNAAEVSPIYDEACAERARYGGDAGCAVTGNAGAALVDVTASPATVAGSVIALLVELGTDNVEFVGFSLADESALQAMADEAAINDASNKARRLADASNVTLGAVTQIQFGEGLQGYDYSERPGRSRFRTVRLAQQQVEPKITPEIDFMLAPQPIEKRAKVTVAYAIE